VPVLGPGSARIDLEREPDAVGEHLDAAIGLQHRRPM